MERAHKLGLICFSSPFNESIFNFLEDLGAPAYKIASFEPTICR
jgi:N-acetylneuraminate synthase